MKIDQPAIKQSTEWWLKQKRKHQLWTAFVFVILLSLKPALSNVWMIAIAIIMHFLGHGKTMEIFQNNLRVEEEEKNWSQLVWWGWLSLLSFSYLVAVAVVIAVDFLMQAAGR